MKRLMLMVLLVSSFSAAADDMYKYRKAMLLDDAMLYQSANHEIIHEGLFVVKIEATDTSVSKVVFPVKGIIENIDVQLMDGWAIVDGVVQAHKDMVEKDSGRLLALIDTRNAFICKERMCAEVFK